MYAWAHVATDAGSTAERLDLGVPLSKETLVLLHWASLTQLLLPLLQSPSGGFQCILRSRYRQLPSSIGTSEPAPCMLTQCISCAIMLTLAGWVTLQRDMGVMVGGDGVPRTFTSCAAVQVCLTRHHVHVLHALLVLHGCVRQQGGAGDIRHGGLNVVGVSEVHERVVIWCLEEALGKCAYRDECR
jgi:hypothetical protein